MGCIDVRNGVFLLFEYLVFSFYFGVMEIDVLIGLIFVVFVFFGLLVFLVGVGFILILFFFLEVLL